MANTNSVLYQVGQAVKAGLSSAQIDGVTSVAATPVGYNIGIGTTNPAYPLDVIGTLRVSEAQTWLRSNSNTSSTLYVNQEGSNASAVFLGGNVGIGTSSPSAPLHIYHTAGAASYTHLTLPTKRIV